MMINLTSSPDYSMSVDKQMSDPLSDMLSLKEFCDSTISQVEHIDSLMQQSLKILEGLQDETKNSEKKKREFKNFKTVMSIIPGLLKQHSDRHKTFLCELTWMDLKKLLIKPEEGDIQEFSRVHFQPEKLSEVERILTECWEKDASDTLEVEIQQLIKVKGSSPEHIRTFNELRKLKDSRGSIQLRNTRLTLCHLIVKRRLDAFFRRGLSFLQINTLKILNFEDLRQFFPEKQLKVQLKKGRLKTAFQHKSACESVAAGREIIAKNRERVRAIVAISKQMSLPLDQVSQSMVQSYLRQEQTDHAMRLQKQTATAFQDLLLAPIEASQAVKAPKQAKKKKKKKKIKVKQEVSSKPSVIKKDLLEQKQRVPFSSACLPMSPTSSSSLICLSTPTSSLRLHPRVKRWAAPALDSATVRSFKDYNSEGEAFFPYAHMSDAEIQKQRIYHRLSGIQYVVSNSGLFSQFGFHYTYTNKVGLQRPAKGLYAELSFKDESTSGVIYVGVGGRTSQVGQKVIYHAQFVPFRAPLDDGSRLTKPLDGETHQSVTEEPQDPASADQEEGWETSGSCLLQRDDTHIIMTYADGVVYTLYSNQVTSDPQPTAL